MSDKFVLTPQNYVFKFGKFKGYKALDVVKIKTVNKNCEEVDTGLQYLEFLVNKCDWFRHADFIKQIIADAKGSTSEVDESKKKKDAKQKKGTVSVSTNETLELNK